MQTRAKERSAHALRKSFLCNDPQMRSFDFEYPFVLAPGEKLPFEEAKINLLDWAEEGQVFFRGADSGKSIQESIEFQIIGLEYLSPESAFEHAQHARSQLSKAFACLGIAVVFGNGRQFNSLSRYIRSSNYAATELGALGIDSLQIHPSDQTQIRFSAHASMTLMKSKALLTSALDKPQTRISMSRKESLAFDFFGTSAFLNDSNMKFILLMMAIEVFINRSPRNKAEIELIDAFISEVKQSAKISDKNRQQSLVNALGNLKTESISSAGIRLIEEMGDRRYNNLPAVEFFKTCTKIRHSLVHGSVDSSNPGDVEVIASNLKLLVGHLIVGREMAEGF